MSNTQSLAFPNMFDVAKNKVSVFDGNQSIVNRCKLLILTEPTELFKNPTFGVGLKRYIWQYNTDNQKQIIRDKIVAQLRQNEPAVDADKTSFSDGLLFTGSTDNSAEQEYNILKMTVGLSTIYGDLLELNGNDLFQNYQQDMKALNAGG